MITNANTPRLKRNAIQYFMPSWTFAHIYTEENLCWPVTSNQCIGFHMWKTPDLDSDSNENADCDSPEESGLVQDHAKLKPPLVISLASYALDEKSGLLRLRDRATPASLTCPQQHWKGLQILMKAALEEEYWNEEFQLHQARLGLTRTKFHH